MTWRVHWSTSAEAFWRNIPVAEAQSAAAAAIRFAETGEGDIRTLPEDPTSHLRLYIGDYVLFISVDEAGEVRVSDDPEEDDGGQPTLWVMRMYRVPR
jgi:mRNA-degrading endonuclease RelE of RelBE toxin-antitoxin system